MVVFTVNKVFYKKTRKVVYTYTVNKVAYRKHPFTTFRTESTTACQYMENDTHQLPQK